MTERAILLAYLAAVSAVLFAVMGADKSRARRKRRRVPESALFFLALIGGAPGGILGMLAFRHKTRHAAFRVGFPLIFAAQAALLIYVSLRLA